jgi:hypothetical protein
MVLAAASMSTDFNYAPTKEQTVAVFIGFITFHGLLNTLSTAWLARITGVRPCSYMSESSITPSSTSDVPLQLLSPCQFYRKTKTTPQWSSTMSSITQAGQTTVSASSSDSSGSSIISITKQQCILGNDRLRCNCTYHRRNEKSGN